MKVLQENISSLGADNETRIFKMPALKFSQIAEHESYDLILADPPFFHHDIHDVAKNILERDYLRQGGIFIIERSVQTREKDVEAFDLDPFKKIGDSLIYQFER